MSASMRITVTSSQMGSLPISQRNLALQRAESHVSTTFSDQRASPTAANFAIRIACSSQNKTCSPLVKKQKAMGRAPLACNHSLLQDQKPGAIRRLTAKLRRAVASATITIANSIAPGQGESLVNLAGLETVLSNRCSSYMEHNSKIDKSFFDHLVHMYQAYESRNLPYDEKIPTPHFDP